MGGMSVRARLERELVNVRKLSMAAGVALAIGAAALPLALATVLLGGGRWISLPAILPFIAWGLVVAVGCLAWIAWRRMGASADRVQLAREVEREQRLRAGSLLGVLELPESALARRAEERLDAKLSGVRGSLVPSLHRRTRRHGVTAASVAVAALAVLAVAAMSSGDGWIALMHPTRAWAGTLVEAPSLSNLPPAVMRGQALTVAVRAPGRREVTLWHRVTGGAWRGDELVVTDGRASLTIPTVDADLVIVASDGRARSDTARVTVTDRPFLADVAIRAIYPVYLERAPELLVAGDPVRVPRGTELRISGTSTTALKSVRLAAEGDTLAMAVDEHSFEGRLLAERDGKWSWLAEAREGGAPEVPEALDISVQPDAPPTVEIVSPARDSQVLATDQLELVARALDDHGLSSVTVRSWRRRADGTQDPERTSRADVTGEPHWAGAIMLALADRALLPGDELRVVVSATDDSPWRQTTTSRELVLRVPSLTDQRANARAAADSAVAHALAAADAQRRLAQRTEDAARRRERSGGTQGNSSDQRRENSLSFESAERARSLAAEQRELGDEVERMREAAQRLEEQLERAGAMDPELQAQLREARKLMQEALTPRLMEQLRKLEQSARQLQSDATQQALGDLAEQQRQMREQLARAADMLRRAALEGSMETLRDEAEELARAQQQLADGSSGEQSQPSRQPSAGEEQTAGPGETSPTPTPEELARRTEQIARDIAQLRERLAAEKASGGERRADEAAQHASAAAEAMKRASDQGANDATGNDQPTARQRDAASDSASQSRGTAQGAQSQGAQSQGGQQQGLPRQSGQQAGGQQAGGQQGAGNQSASGGQQMAGGQGGGMRQDAARAAEEMRRTAEELAAARSEQVAEWKSELTSALDRAVSELQQMSREQSALEQRTREGADAGEVRGRQGALQQGIQGIAQRLREEGRRSTLLSQGSQDAVARAQREVQQAAQQAASSAGQQGGSPSAQAGQTADAMASAAQAMSEAAAALVRDRARANDANSATGMAEMLEMLQRLAAQQGNINSQASGLLSGMGGQRPSASAMAQARELARQQRTVARQLESLGGDADGSDAMAAEARSLAQAMESGALDPATVNRQQRLFRRMLEAGMTLEQDEIDFQAPRQGETARSTDRFTPADSAVSGRAAERYPVPTWDELRRLNPDDRRVVMEYFRRLNAAAEGSGAQPRQPVGGGAPARVP